MYVEEYELSSSFCKMEDLISVWFLNTNQPQYWVFLSSDVFHLLQILRFMKGNSSISP